MAAYSRGTALAIASARERRTVAGKAKREWRGWQTYLLGRGGIGHCVMWKWIGDVMRRDKQEAQLSFLFRLEVDWGVMQKTRKEKRRGFIKTFLYNGLGDAVTCSGRVETCLHGGALARHPIKPG